MDFKEIKTTIDEINTGVKETKTAQEITIAEIKSLKIENDAFKTSNAELKARLDEMELKMKRTPLGGSETKENKYFDGQKAARLWKCQLANALEQKQGNAESSVYSVAEKIYGNDKKFIEEVKAISAGGDSGVLIEEAYYAEIIPLLYNKIVVKNLGAHIVPMPNGNLNMKKMISGTSAKYVGESKSVLATEPKFSNIKLSSKKLTVKTVFSNDLLRSASPAADLIVRDDMVEQMQIAFDYVALYGTGGEYSPLGIANTPGVTTFNAGTLVEGDAMFTQHVAPLLKANINMVRPGWAFNYDTYTALYNETFAGGFMYKYRDELKEGKFHGYPYVATNQIATGVDSHGLTDVFFGDFDKFFIGEQLSLELQTSLEASYLDVNGVTQSSFDNDETVIRGIMVHDMGIIYGQAFSYGKWQTK